MDHGDYGSDDVGALMTVVLPGRDDGPPGSRGPWVCHLCVRSLEPKSQDAAPGPVRFVVRPALRGWTSVVECGRSPLSLV